MNSWAVEDRSSRRKELLSTIKLALCLLQVPFYLFSFIRSFVFCLIAFNNLQVTTTRRKGQDDVLDTRAMRGVDSSTDHVMIRSKLAFVLRKEKSKTSGNSACKLNVKKLHNEDVIQEFQEHMDEAMDYKDDACNLVREMEKVKDLSPQHSCQSPR